MRVAGPAAFEVSVVPFAVAGGLVAVAAPVRPLYGGTGAVQRLGQITQAGSEDGGG